MNNNYTYRILDKILRRLVRQKKWHLAYFLIHSTGLSFGISGWLDKHVEYCSESTKEYRLYSRPNMVSSRLAAIGYKLISSKSIHAGLVNIGAMIHDVVDNKTNNTRKIFEKVYHQYHSQSVEQEELLYDQINAKDIAAPDFKGKYIDGPFISLFYDYIESTPLSIQDEMISKYELISKLWKSRPTRKMIDNCQNKDFVELLLNTKYIDGMLEASKSDQDRMIVSFLTINTKEIISEFRKLPRVIVHKDIGPWNILKSNDGNFYLIDWDKWCISNLGAGLLIQTEELFNPLFIRYLSPSNQEHEHNFTRLEVLRNVCIYNLTYNLRFKNFQNALNWCYAYYNLR